MTNGNCLPCLFPFYTCVAYQMLQASNLRSININTCKCASMSACDIWHFARHGRATSQRYFASSSYTVSANHVYMRAWLWPKLISMKRRVFGEDASGLPPGSLRARVADKRSPASAAASVCRRIIFLNKYIGSLGNAIHDVLYKKLYFFQSNCFFLFIFEHFKRINCYWRH